MRFQKFLKFMMEPYTTMKYIFILALLSTTHGSSDVNNNDIIKKYQVEIQELEEEIEDQLLLLAQAVEKELKKINALANLYSHHLSNVKIDIRNEIPEIESRNEQAVKKKYGECKFDYDKAYNRINFNETRKCVSFDDVKSTIYKGKQKILKPILKNVKCKKICQEKSNEKCASCYEDIISETNSLLLSYSEEVMDKIDKAFYQGLKCVHNKNYETEEKLCHIQSGLESCIEKVHKELEEKSCLKLNRNLQYKLKNLMKIVKVLERQAHRYY